MKESPAKNSKAITSVMSFDASALEIFNNVFEFYGTVDKEGCVLDLRGRIFEETNTDPHLLASQRFSETVFWQSSENTSKFLEKAIEQAAAGESPKLILDFRISADEKVPLDLRFQPIVDGTIFVCAQAVAERDQVEHYKQESEQLLFAAENAEIGLWFWDFGENKIYSTPRCNEILGFPAYELITFDSFLQTVHPDDREFVDEFIRRSRTEGTKYEDEFRVVYSDGSIDWIGAEGKSFLNSEGKPQRMMGVVRKITEQKIAAEELAMVYDRERKARSEAVEANRAKDLFLAFVSHELRSPLNAILGWSKILLTKTVDEETRVNALETIERSARAQTKLINDLVDSARVASGKLRLEYHPTNICEIVRASYQGQKPLAEAHNLTFDLTTERDDIDVFGDSGRLQQVFTNLISNAIKFTPDGGRVSIEIKPGDGTVSVHVKDSGQGISPEALPDIFQQFAQGDMNREPNNLGLGLGLSIVKILVGKHGGSVKALSEGLGKGSEFIVTLPLSDSRVESEPALHISKAPNPKPLRGMKILIVEDDHDSREVLQLFLEQCGAAVTSAEAVQAALEQVTKSVGRLPNIIISDLAMPEEDGYTLIERIRSMPENSGGSIPAIALSAFSTFESKQKAFEAGFQKYSTKPFEPDRLILDIVELVSANN
jgi:PAS domain S-box-containing protein